MQPSNISVVFESFRFVESEDSYCSTLDADLCLRVVVVAADDPCTWCIWWFICGGELVGYVRRTTVTDFESCFAKVLSNTSAYMPPSPLGTSYFPLDTLLASQIPYQNTGLSPMLLSFSVAVEDAFRDVCDSFSVSSGRIAGVGGGSKVNEGNLRVGALPWPGCLKIPKLMDFFCGSMLKKIVCSASTSTQRTRYDLLR